MLPHVQVSGKESARTPDGRTRHLSHVAHWAQACAVALLDRAVSEIGRVHEDVRGAALVGLDEAVPFFKNVPEADARLALL